MEAHYPAMQRIVKRVVYASLHVKKAWMYLEKITKMLQKADFYLLGKSISILYATHIRLSSYHLEFS